jgi:hypothetical protein
MMLSAVCFSKGGGGFVSVLCILRKLDYLDLC